MLEAQIDVITVANFGSCAHFGPLPLFVLLASPFHLKEPCLCCCFCGDNSVKSHNV